MRVQEQHTYSNMATALNGYITEIVSATPFDDFCDANIFEALCMEKTAWHMTNLDSNEVARPILFRMVILLPIRIMVARGITQTDN